MPLHVRTKLSEAENAGRHSLMPAAPLGNDTSNCQSVGNCNGLLRVFSGKSKSIIKSETPWLC